MQKKSQVVQEIEEYIVKVSMGYKMDAVSIEQLNKWKVMFIAELNSARIEGIGQGIKMSPRPVDRIYGV